LHVKASTQADREEWIRKIAEVVGEEGTTILGNDQEEEKASKLSTQFTKRKAVIDPS
jgi:ABC-type Fe3+-hydroxamate transport system substrate-binding protein